MTNLAPPPVAHRQLITEDALQRVLQRAVELNPGSEHGLTLHDVQRVAADLDVDSVAVEHAFAEELVHERAEQRVTEAKGIGRRLVKRALLISAATNFALGLAAAAWYDVLGVDSVQTLLTLSVFVPTLLALILGRPPRPRR